MKTLVTKCVFASVVLVSTAGLSGGACAQTQHADHTGRVTRSYTEPIVQSVVASTEIGVIYAAKVQEGDRVAVNEELAVLNHDVLLQTKRIAIARAESTATRDAARAQAEMVKSQKFKIESLVGGGHVNAYEVEQKATEYQNAIAELQAAENELLLARLEVDRIEAQLRQRMIKSPIDGIVTKIHKQLGEQVSTTEPQYATVVQIDRLKVRFYLDEETLFKISVGANVNVLIGKDKTKTAAIVSYVSPIIDPDSGTGRLEVVIDNADLKIKSGMVCYWSNEATAGKRIARQNNAKHGAQRSSRTK